MGRLTYYSVIIVGILMSLYGCESPLNEAENNNSNVFDASKFNGTTSHTNAFRGLDCFMCHDDGGGNINQFSIAGTVYEQNLTTIAPNTTFYFYTEPNSGGELVITVEVDANGNFYTDESIDFGSGLWGVVEDLNGNRYYKPNPITTGNCNICHNTSNGITAPVYVNSVGATTISKFVSTYTSTDSHIDARQNSDCTTCHSEVATSGKNFSVIGSVMNNEFNQRYANATVYLYTQSNGNGNLVKTIEADGNGNFFSTQDIDFGTGLYPAIKGTLGEMRYMDFSIQSGDCNACHNNSTAPIYAP